MKRDPTIPEKLSGRFIVLDGPDGGGKTTQRTLLARHLESLGMTVIETRDPGGTQIGDRVRNVLLGYDLSVMDVRCETFLFMASRAQLVAEVIDPAIAAGAVVVCDRFISSTYAYQGAAGYDVAGLLELGNLAVGNTWPDLTLILDVPVEVGFQRIRTRGRSVPRKSATQAKDVDQAPGRSGSDAMESRPPEFHQRVREMFLSLPGVYPKPVRIVDGQGTEQEVHGRILEQIERVDL